MVTFILFVLGLDAFLGIVRVLKGLHDLWIGEQPGVNFVTTCLVSAFLVCEIKAFQWLWQLDDRFDLSALASSAGL